MPLLPLLTEAGSGAQPVSRVIFHASGNCFCQVHCSGSEEEEEEEEEWSDDEDTSWKVRRAAAKAVAAVISHYPDLLAEVGTGVAWGHQCL